MPPHLEDRHDPRVVEVGRSLGLLAESPDLPFTGERPGQDHLHRNRTIEARLPRRYTTPIPPREISSSSS